MTTYHDLVIQCPACIAQNSYDNHPPRQWYHANCGGKIQIGDDAFYKCLFCGHSSHVKNWRYVSSTNLSHCEIDDQYKGRAHFANAISVAGQVTNLAGRQWLLTFLQNLGDW